MSVSSHLSPEPERRLWIIHESLAAVVERAERMIAGLAAIALAELLILKLSSGPALAALPLLLAVGVSLLAFSPLAASSRWPAVLDSSPGRPGASDCFIEPEDIVKYSHSDLILKLDRYLGGGITATQYYEDIVGQIALKARLALRKESLQRAAALLVGLGQIGVLAAFLDR